MPPTKKIAAWAAVVLLIYAVLTSPDDTAGKVGPVLDFAFNGVKNVFVFFNALLTRN
ncbi:hypothetical protein LCH21_01110 [Patescibacteria group bacterium]|nr:hypothetical protein [Patescibacteria group bacterium]